MAWHVMSRDGLKGPSEFNSSNLRFDQTYSRQIDRLIGRKIDRSLELAALAGNSNIQQQSSPHRKSPSPKPCFTFPSSDLSARFDSQLPGRRVLVVDPVRKKRASRKWEKKKT